jgi:hypothetical protein
MAAEISPEAKAMLNAIEIEINNKFLKRKLTGLDTILSFFENEIKSWNEIDSTFSTANQITRKFVGYIGQIVQNCNVIKNITASNNYQQQLAEIGRVVAGISSNAQRNNIYYTETPQAQFIISLIKNGANLLEVSGADTYLQGAQLTGLDSKEYVIGFLKAYEFDHQDDSKMIKRRDAEEPALESLREKWFKCTNDLQIEYNGLDKRYKDWEKKNTQYTEEWFKDRNVQLDKLLSDAEKRIKENEDLYQTKLRLEGPVTYWERRTKGYRTRGYWWLGGLSAVSIALVILLVWILYHVPPVFLTQADKGIKGNADFIIGGFLWCLHYSSFFKINF